MSTKVYFVYMLWVGKANFNSISII